MGEDVCQTTPTHYLVGKHSSFLSSCQLKKLPLMIEPIFKSPLKEEILVVGIVFVVKYRGENNSDRKEEIRGV